MELILKTTVETLGEEGDIGGAVVFLAVSLLTYQPGRLLGF